MSEANKESNPVSFTYGDAQRIAKTVLTVEGAPRQRKPSWLPRAAGSGGKGSPIRLGQCSGPWPNEPNAPGGGNIRAVRLYKQPDNPSSPQDWVPESDDYGDPVFAVTINWFSHVPAGTGDVVKWCAVTPISSLEGEYDTGQKTYVEGVEVPVMKSYGSLWLLLAVEC